MNTGSVSVLPSLGTATIGVIGLGYVGLPLAVEFAKRGKVVGFDIKGERIRQLSEGHDSTLEVNSEDLKAAINLSFSNALDDLATCTVFVVTVPTPVGAQKRPDLTALLNASSIVGEVLKRAPLFLSQQFIQARRKVIAYQRTFFTT